MKQTIDVSIPLSEKMDSWATVFEEYPEKDDWAHKPRARLLRQLIPEVKALEAQSASTSKALTDLRAKVEKRIKEVQDVEPFYLNKEDKDYGQGMQEGSKLMGNTVLKFIDDAAQSLQQETGGKEG